MCVPLVWLLLGLTGLVWSSEVPSPCYETEIQCKSDNQCIPRTWRCDGGKDCIDNSDEEGCVPSPCYETEIQCKSDNQCIPRTWRCDGEKDCIDNSDEEGCVTVPSPCYETEIQCKSHNQCIPRTWRCNGEKDCIDNSDEEGCEPVICAGDTVPCDQKCIPKAWICDGEADCSDSSDEQNCTKVITTCSPTDFQCTTGECIHRSWKCDEEKDCLDGSDEMNCEKKGPKCNDNQFTCVLDSSCIPSSSRCDDISNCVDGSDEVDCKAKPSCSGQEFTCANGNCVHKYGRCDGIEDCSDGSDETNCVIGNPCLQKNGECEHECIFEEDAKVCTCRMGFQLASDGVSCTDIDECTMSYTVCAQICTNTVGSFECSCMSGYAEDGDRCKAIGGSARLVFSNRHEIREFSLETNTSRIILDDLESVVAIDFDVKANLLYYSDVGSSKICQTTFDGSQQSVIVNEDILTPDDIAFDWVHGNFYWSDAGYNTISVISLWRDKHYRNTLVSEGLDEPRAVVVDPREGQRWLYWTDWGEDAKIERAGLDGSSRVTLVNKTDVVWPNGLTIDFTNNRFYWADAKLNRIGTANLDGTDVRIVIEDNDAIKHPFSIDVFENWVFWTDWSSEGIYKTEKSIRAEPQLVLGDLRHAMGMRVYHEVKQPFSRNVCGVNNGGCVQLCLPSPAVYPSSPEYRCAYADNMVKMPTTTTTEWVNTTKTTVEATEATSNETVEATAEAMSNETVEATEAMSNETMWPDYPTDDVSEILEVAGIVFGVAAIVAIVATLGMFM